MTRTTTRTRTTKKTTTTTTTITTTTTTAATGAEPTTSGASPSPSAGRHDSAAGDLVGELYAEHGRMVLGLCRLLLRDPVEAEDASQQVFLSAHRALLGGSAPREPHAWLAAIARNECRARIQARMREPLALPELPSDLPDPLAAAIRAVDLDAVWAALSTLPRRQRRALVLREVGGLSYHELGRALGVSQSAVESLLFRARRQLRAFFANAAAASIALRDDLERLIPAFDPGSVGLAARVASLPVALKLATTAVAVGVVTTGGSQLAHNARPVETHASVTRPAVAVAKRVERPSPAFVTQRPVRAQTVRQHEPARRSGREGEDRRGHGQGEREHRDADVREEHERSGRGPADVEERELEEVEDRGHTETREDNEGPSHSGSSDDHSGPGSSDD